MKKTNVTISLDHETYAVAKATIDNLSGFFNEVLKHTLQEDNPEAKQVFDIRKYIDSLEKIKKDKEEELNFLDIQIEKKKISKREGLCMRCDSVADRNYLGQLICKQCFMSL